MKERSIIFLRIIIIVLSLGLVVFSNVRRHQIDVETVMLWEELNKKD